ncbi:MAG: NADH:ubiquinone reductase (Na(+)-transporting) subunit B [Gammaproteobacteria bacterium]|jgi:Na+-transporting NADH:ubiquinone oxidoreductase subunit B|nr:NADH:ubiquinone reductase (Na(+)-transporting) subunit B [Gammaproteobacteria bacterium]|tara:strand:+ start:2806 stop:4017 length:1212 start_codon:yes stop_codon:yes gene_type:complete
MGALRRSLDRLAPHFAQGGRLQRYGALFEMIDTLLYTPADRTRVAPHVRDGADLKRVMILVVLAAAPAALVGVWNTGHQASLAMAELNLAAAPGWRGAVMAALGLGYEPGAVLASVVHGLLYFLPIYLVTLAVGGAWEVLFATVRNHEVNEGFLVTSLLYALVLPPTVPLWQVALGISFGVVIGKEVFGGTGKNLLNPALLGRAFLYFAYPAEISGTGPWVAVDGFTRATPLSVAAESGLGGVLQADYTWWSAFLGNLPGSIGETSALACLFGGAFLMYAGIASWRIVAGVFLGMTISALLFNALGPAAGAMADLPWHWHLVLGGFAFGMMFMATDPVTAAQTDVGRWWFGLLIGTFTVIVRVMNPAFPEAVMMAILFGNLFAPLIDQVVVHFHVRKQARRHV